MFLRRTRLRAVRTVAVVVVVVAAAMVVVLLMLKLMLMLISKSDGKAEAAAAAAARLRLRLPLLLLAVAVEAARKSDNAWTYCHTRVFYPSALTQPSSSARWSLRVCLWKATGRQWVPS
jgi:hypothetical protein